MLIGTAGHIDHGKTALVKALTGVDADRLPEEKARGITIDLGYAYSSDGRLAFVDVPGHERLIHNMLAGAIGVDFVLLVVAADDGPMPQTREHLAIFHLLEVRRGAVAISKTDRVDAVRLRQVNDEVRALLAGTSLATASVFETSSRTGEGIDALRAHLEAESILPAMPAEAAGFRLAIDRSFAVTGIGTVVTGTVHAGRVVIDDTVMLSPPGMALRVRGLHVNNRPARTAGAGERCALNLTGDGFSREKAQRGHWVTAPRLHRPTQCIDVRLRLLPGDGTLKHWTPVHAYMGTAHANAHVALLEGEVLRAGESMLAQLALDRPVAVLHGDGFVLRDPSATRTLGGGRIIDPFAVARGRRGMAHRNRLVALQESSARGALSALAELSPAGVDVAAFAQMRNIDLARMQDMTAALPDAWLLPDGKNGLLLTRRAWHALADDALATLTHAHQHEPDTQGVSRDRLRRMMATAVAPAAFDALIDQLRQDGRIAQAGVWLHLPEHRAQLGPEESALWSRMAPLLAQRAAQPPRVRDLARALGLEEDRVRITLKRCARVGEVHQVAHDHFYPRGSIVEIAGIAVHLGGSSGEISAARFRDALGTGRKLSIHILEFFDRVGFTRRVRDTHIIRNPRLFSPVAAETGGYEGGETSPGGAAGFQIR